MSRRSGITLCIAFVLTLGAGMVLGDVWMHWQIRSGKGEAHRDWIAEQLALTPQQRQQMDDIWAKAGQQISKTWDLRRQLDRDRDQAIVALLSDQQKAQYDALLRDFRAKRSELDKQRDQLRHDAEAQSRALLDPNQQRVWDTLQQSHDHHGPHGPWPASSPTTMPIGEAQH
jgi:Spy/CpxP family protein refolding chaperone